MCTSPPPQARIAAERQRDADAARDAAAEARVGCERATAAAQAATQEAESTRRLAESTERRLTARADDGADLREQREHLHRAIALAQVLVSSRRL